LWGRWTTILENALKLTVTGNPADLIGHCHYAEWKKLDDAMQCILTSRSEACGSAVCPPAVSVRVTTKEELWTLRIVLPDAGPGIVGIRSCFLTESENVPTEFPAKTHKLQRAQALLWGYCRWAMHSKTSGGAVQSYDVYAESESVEWETDNGAQLIAGPSGTAHVLEFDNPLQADWGNGDASYDL